VELVDVAQPAEEAVIWGALLLAVLGGCQVVLGLDRVPDPGSGTGSGSMRGANGHDEDCDGVPDASDVCPGIADDQTDTDSDGVGDACDPQPGKPDTLVEFYAFDRANDLAQFTPFGGHWTIHDDSLANDETTSNQEDHLLEGMTRDVPIAIETDVTVDAIAPTPPKVVDLSFAVEYRTSEADEYSCAIRRTSDSNDQILDQVEVFALGSSSDQPLSQTQLRPGAEYQIREVLAGTRVRCEMMGIAGDGGSVSATVAMPALPESVGFYTQDTAVHYHYLAIYALGS
jgi:hypothetical protein